METGRMMERIREDAKKLGEILDFEAVEPSREFDTVSATDGGVVVRKYSMFDMIYYRAVSAVFEKRSVRFHPERYVKPKAVPSPSGNTKKHASLLRVHEELSEFIDVASEGVELAMLDGSLFPHPSLKSRKWGGLYNDVLSLYEKARKYDAAGIIKDPKSMELAKRIGSPFRDISILSFAMPENTMAISSRKGNVTCFYLKIGKDFPLRIETTADARRVASHVMFSSIPYVNLPKEIIYADRAARISKRDVMAMESGALRGLFMKRRRDRRL